MPSKTDTTIARRFLHELLSIPTAPFAEHRVIEFLERFCARRKRIALSRDKAGNMLLRVRQGTRRIARPVCITAHLDHPGFVADRMLPKRRVCAFWRGGVPPEYFVGSRVRFHVNGKWVHGRVRSIKTVVRNKRRRVDTANIDVPRDVPPGSIGMWDLPEPKVRPPRIHAPACDDLVGAAAMLACIDRLYRRRLGCDAYFLFTRAEEVGFMGAIAACRLKTIPGKCFVVAMETSTELPNARMGDGPILRVGDRMSVFTPGATLHCRQAADDLAKADKQFKFQRKLMDGGTCESSAYCLFGYDATGLCVALGNYHNADTKRKKIAPEYVDLNDFDNVVKWFVELARAPHPYTGRDDNLRNQLKDVERTYKPLLRASVKHPR
jgi:endoglucanase